jgi:hypothetical protein
MDRAPPLGLWKEGQRLERLGVLTGFTRAKTACALINFYLCQLGKLVYHTHRQRRPSTGPK